MEELDDGFTYAISRYKAQVCQDTHTVQCCTEVRGGPEASPCPGPQNGYVGPKPAGLNLVTPLERFHGFLT